jgi:hypothetical protein
MTRKEALMGYPTRVQLIKRKASEQWYINFPAAIARAMEFLKGEIVEWIIHDRATLILKRGDRPRAQQEPEPKRKGPRGKR